MNGTLKVSVWRGTGKGHYQTFDVPRRTSQTVLDVVTWIQRHAAPDLAYRFACRVGVCGSCAMTVNGLPRWTCRSPVAKVARDGLLQIGPLANLPIVRDLVTDMSAFFDKWNRAKGAFSPGATRTDPLSRIVPGSAGRKAVDAAIECINCAVCYAACDTVRWNADYLGPAALNRAWSLINDERDSANSERLAVLSAAGGCHDCHSHQSCQQLCPKSLNPTRSIAGLKRLSMTSCLNGELKGDLIP